MKAIIKRILDYIKPLFTAFITSKLIKQSNTIKNLKRKIRVDEKINKIDNRRVNRNDVAKWLQHGENSKE